MRNPSLIAVAALALADPLVAQTPVHSLPGETGDTFSYLTITQQAEYADSVSLGSTERYLDQAAVTIFSNSDHLSLDQLAFADIHTLVPDDLFWSVKFENISSCGDGGALDPKLEDVSGLPPSDAATDSSRTDDREESGDGWMPIWTSSDAPPTDTLSPQHSVHSVPESSVALLASLAAGFLVRRRRG